MSGLEPLLRALTEATSIDLAGATELLAGARLDADRSPVDVLEELSARLPLGLAHAQSLWALGGAPEGAERLAPESPWWSFGAGVVVSLPPSGEGFTALLLDLIRYTQVAATLEAALEGRDDLVEALAAPTLAAGPAVELSVALGATQGSLLQLDARAPGLRAEMAWLAQGGFAPVLHVHEDLRPAVRAARGRAVAEALVPRLPGGDLILAVSDDPGLLESLSPYARDLGHALVAWALENPERLSVPGLADALEEEGASDPELLALVVRDLFAASPELLAERRAAEATQGLYLADDRGLAYGVADLARLAAPDPTVVVRRSGHLVAVAGTGSESLAAVVEAILDSGRVRQIALSIGAAIPDGPVAIPESLVSPEDAWPLARAPRVAEEAERLQIPVRGPVACDAAASPLAIRLLGQVRRARALGRVPPEVEAAVALYPARPRNGPPTLEQALGAPRAARLALSTLLSDLAPSPARSRTKPAVALPRRFRA